MVLVYDFGDTFNSIGCLPDFDYIVAEVSAADFAREEPQYTVGNLRSGYEESGFGGLVDFVDVGNEYGSVNL